MSFWYKYYNVYIESRALCGARGGCVCAPLSLSLSGKPQWPQARERGAQGAMFTSRESSLSPYPIIILGLPWDERDPWGEGGIASSPRAASLLLPTSYLLFFFLLLSLLRFLYFVFWSLSPPPLLPFATTAKRLFSHLLPLPPAPLTTRRHNAS